MQLKEWKNRRSEISKLKQIPLELRATQEAAELRLMLNYSLRSHPEHDRLSRSHSMTVGEFNSRSAFKVAFLSSSSVCDLKFRQQRSAVNITVFLPPASGLASIPLKWQKVCQHLKIRSLLPLLPSGAVASEGKQSWRRQAMH